MVKEEGWLFLKAIVLSGTMLEKGHCLPRRAARWWEPLVDIKQQHSKYLLQEVYRHKDGLYLIECFQTFVYHYFTHH